jgi:altronate hydrolase
VRQFPATQATQRALLQVHAADSVAVCLRDVRQGEQLTLGERVIEIRADAPRGHKVALKPHHAGEVVTKYGHGIGHALKTISSAR